MVLMIKSREAIVTYSSFMENLQWDIIATNAVDISHSAYWTIIHIALVILLFIVRILAY